MKIIKTANYKKYFQEGLSNVNQGDDFRLQEIAEKAYEANRQKDYARMKHWLRGLLPEEKRIVQEKMKEIGKNYQRPFEPFF